MTNRVFTLLLLAALFLTAFSVALSRRDARAWRANRSRKVFPFAWKDAAAFVAAKPNGERLAFEKGADGEWRVRLDAETADVLSRQAVDDFSALFDMTWREPLRGGEAPVPDRAVVLTATAADGQTATVTLGGTRDNRRAAVIADDPDGLYGINQDLLGFLDWPRSRFRELSLMPSGTGRKARRVVLSPGGPDETLTIELERTGDKWRLTQPVAWPADETRLDVLLRWQERLRAESVAAESTGDPEWFGFTPKAAFVETTYEDGGVRRVEFGGDAEEGKIYARDTGRNPIFVLPGEALAEISLDAAAAYPRLWRDFYRRRVFSAAGSDLPAAITVERLLPSPATLVLERLPGNGGKHWRGTLEENGTRREFAVEPPDPADPMRPLTALLTGLSSLRARVFLANTEPGPETDKWTAHPAWRFSCRDENGRAFPALTLYAAAATGALPPGVLFAEGVAGPVEEPPPPGRTTRPGIAFFLEGEKAVMETAGELGYLLCLPPYRYQSRLLVESDPRQWRRVEVTAGGRTEIYSRDPGDVNEQWWRGDDGREPLMDDNNLLAALFLELSRLKTEAFVADAGTKKGEFGLDRPAITAIVYVAQGDASGKDADGRLFSLRIGTPAAGTNGARYACLDAAGPVFLIPGRLAEALEKSYR